jgi:hypothetical protein
MHFDRAHTDAKFEGNDFVGPACNQCVEDLTLAPAEDCDPTRRHQFLADTLIQSDVRECGVKGQEQHLMVDRLFYEVECTVLHRGHCTVDIALPAEHNCRNTNVQGPQPCLQLLAMPNVHQYAATPHSGRSIEESVAGSVCDGLELCRPQQLLQRQAHSLFIGHNVYSMASQHGWPHAYTSDRMRHCSTQ